MFDDFKLSNVSETGISMIDKVTSDIRQTIALIGSKSFEIAYQLASAFDAPSFNAALKETSFKDAMEWAMTTFGMKDSMVYQYVHIGRYTEKITVGKKSLYRFIAIRDSFARFTFDENGNVTETTYDRKVTIDGVEYDAYSFDIPEFSMSAAGIIADGMTKKNTKLTRFVVARCVREGILRPSMSVLDIKATVKALVKGETVDISTEKAEKAEKVEKTEKGEKTAKKEKNFTIDGSNVVFTLYTGQGADGTANAMTYSIPVETLKDYLVTGATSDNTESEVNNND